MFYTYFEINCIFSAEQLLYFYAPKQTLDGIFSIVRLFFSLLLFDHLLLWKMIQIYFWWSIYSNHFDENRYLKRYDIFHSFYLYLYSRKLSIGSKMWILVRGWSNRTYQISFSDIQLHLYHAVPRNLWLLLSLLKNFSKYQKILCIISLLLKVLFFVSILLLSTIFNFFD